MSEAWPKGSIVIATHNMLKYLPDTIWSCLTQIYPGDVEIVVYDDASTDGTKDSGWPLLVRYFRGDENLGVGDAFNAGIYHATGEIIVLMCADDLWVNKFSLISTVIPFIRYPGCGVVARCYHQFIDGDPEKKPCAGHGELQWTPLFRPITRPGWRFAGKRLKDWLYQIT